MTTFSKLTRTASLVFAIGAGVALAVRWCTPTDGPHISRFSTDKPHYFIGESAVVEARFQGGQARLEPFGIKVESGVPIVLAQLERAVALRLVVSSGATSVEKRILIGVHPRASGAWCG